MNNKSKRVIRVVVLVLLFLTPSNISQEPKEFKPIVVCKVN